MSAAAQFMEVANATAALAQRNPAYISYRVHGTVHVKRGERDFERVVVYRTADGRAVVKAGTGAGKAGAAEPLPPDFDALAKFDVKGFVHADGVLDMHIVNLKALQYNVSSQADTVARSLKDYEVSVVDDAPPGQVHLHLHGTPAFFKINERWIDDVWYDAASHVPTRIVWGGANEFVLDTRYSVASGAWLVKSVDIRKTLHPWFVGSSPFSAHCDFDDYRTGADESAVAPA